MHAETAVPSSAQHENHHRKPGRSPAQMPQAAAPGALKTRRVMIGPSFYANVRLPSSVLPAPRTKLGLVAAAIADQTYVTTISVAAISGYVYAITQASSPPLTFTGVPPGMSGDQLPALQNAYSEFQQQFAGFQGQAEAWINTQPGTGQASIFSQLVSVPNTLANINGTVQSNFSLLGALQPGSPAYQSTLTQQEHLINAELSSITMLNGQMQTLGTNLNTGSTALVQSTQTGILAQLLAAYQADITALTNAITQANSQISADNAKIIGEGVGAGTSIAVGLVGLINIWNPIGWILMAGGAIGAYYAITEIEALKAEVARLQAQIQTDIQWQDTDESAASQVSSFSQLVQGFASLNTAAQQELAQLEALYAVLAADITQAVTDLQNNDLTDAQNEWNTLLSAAGVLEGLTAYLWPPSTLLSAPSTFAAVGGDVYYIATSGEMFHYAGSANAWTDMNVTALSCVGQGGTIVAIDGAPINGSSISSNPSTPTYYVKSYNPSNGGWTTISTFPAAAIAAGSAGIFAVNQTVASRQVYQYSGSGVAWTALASLPGPDAATQIAVAGGTVFALANNSQFLYQYQASSSSWSQVLQGTTISSITGNGNMLGIIDTNQNAYTYDPTSGAAPVALGAGVSQIAQLTSGSQYRTGTNLDLVYAQPTSPPTYTYEAANVTGVYSSDTNAVYYTDNLGNLFQLNASGHWTQVPAIP